jgi:hypothetical protein
METNQDQPQNEFEETTGEITALPADDDMSALPQLITRWRKNMDEIAEIKVQVREKTKHSKTLEDAIMRIMKKNGIDALALRNSGGRVRLKEVKRPEGLGPKNLQRIFTERFNDEQQAKDLLDFINSKRTTKESAKLVHESVDV